MNRNSTTYTRTIESLDRLRSSVNGNPRFLIHFTDGSTAKTAPDAACSYGIENRSNIGVPVTISAYRKSGNVWGIRPVS